MISCFRAEELGNKRKSIEEEEREELERKLFVLF
jgi:hypothetical protein